MFTHLTATALTVAITCGVLFQVATLAHLGLRARR